MADLGPGFGAVRLPARAAPWLSAGLKVLLRPEGWRERQAEADAAALAEASTRVADRAEPPVAPPAPRLARPAAQPVPSLKTPDAPAQRQPAQNGSSQDRASQDRSGQDWPDQWAGFLARVARPSRVLFTYWELGADMAGVASGEDTDARRALFQEIVKQLREKAGWPKGAAGFWPIAACDVGNELRAQPDLFLRGLGELKPRMVCVFGERALRVIDPDAAYVHGPRRVRGLNCLILPGPEEMLPDNREAKRVVWNWLRGQDVA